MGLWHNEYYALCPSPNFVMGLLQYGNVTQWVLPCLSRSCFCYGTAARWDCDTKKPLPCLSHPWFCHGTVTRRDCDTVSVTLSVPLLILLWDCCAMGLWHNETVTLSVPLLILSWDCYKKGLWHNECYPVCPSPDFVMGLQRDETLTQWVLPCLSQC